MIALALHAEKLHDDDIWHRIERVARWTGRRGVKTTFFVYPFPAQVAGKDVTNRVRAIEMLGHEIGQHTHFYAGRKIDKPEKVTDLSEANIIHCLHRDFNTLRQMGTPPQGFTAGAWFINETVLDTLSELGFVYDCSSRFPKPKETTKSLYHRWLRSPEFYASVRGRVLCLPTTCSLGEWFRWGRYVKNHGSNPYRLVYLHDYDLLAFKSYLAIWVFLMTVQGAKSTSALTLAKSFLEQEVA